MAKKTRLNSKFHSGGDGPIPPHSYRRSIVWRFLQSIKPGTDEVGQMIQLLKDRRDMPTGFPHRKSVTEYLTRCKIDSAAIARTVYQIYNLYQEFLKAAHSEVGDGPPTGLNLSDWNKAKPSLTREQLARSILQGMNLFEDPDQHFKLGGKWVDSAYGAADAVVSLIIATARSDAAKGKGDFV